MPRFPRPWSKKRGKRFASTALRGVAGEAVFYAALILIGVFVLSLVLINRFGLDRIPVAESPELSSSLSFWIFGVLSLAAFGSGVAGMIISLTRMGASSERRAAIAQRAGSIEIIGPSSDDSSKLPSVPQGRSLTDSPGERLTYRLASENSPAAEAAGPAALALLWNAVWFILLAVVVSGFWFGTPRWVLAGMLIPFGGIGIWSFRFFLTQLRQTAGIGATIVEISNHPLMPGEQYRIFVSQSGRLRLRKITVHLTCEEEAFYRQGTDVRVEHREAFTQELLTERNVRVDPQAPWEQQLQLDLPENVMHSFVGAHNAIRWKIVVSGEARPWPSFCQSFPVVVHPPGAPPKRSPR